jgi:hypothetical protein
MLTSTLVLADRILTVSLTESQSKSAPAQLELPGAWQGKEGPSHAG